METYEHILNGESITYLFTRFKFFTELSNLCMGICALIYANYLCNHINNKGDIPKTIRVLKLICTTGVVITFLTVFIYLIPVSGDNWLFLVSGSQFIFHILNPILAFITFIFFEDNKVECKYVLYNIFPITLYGIFYLSVALTHRVNGVIPYEYDWYLFMSHGIKIGLITFAIMTVFNMIIVYVLNSLSGKFIKE